MNDKIIDSLLKNPDLKKVNKTIKKSISDLDIERYFSRSVQKDIIKYSDLKNYSSIDQLLPKNKSFKFMLLESKHNSGHWLGLLRYNKTIEFFNSYG